MLYKLVNQKKTFPFNQSKNGNSLVYLDSTATTQKPQKVIDAITSYYKKV